LAGPTGGQVVAGSAALANSGNSLIVTQTSNRAIITWQDFSLGAGDLARFIQPDATSATLNRVISNLPSALNGTLQSNGQVYLINPNGILIGAGARIDTGGFLASTLDVANPEFLAGGDLHFSGESTAAIKNLGAINALGGDVFLIARAVENQGVIGAANGAAGLAAGSEILLTTGGDERLFVQAVSQPGTLVNAGTIAATTAELTAAGGNSYALAINNSGLVRATGSAVRGGQLWLVASGESTVRNSGGLDASSPTGQGGKVVVSGGQVLLADGAKLEASGATGGGEVDVGGGWQGGAAAVANASAVVVQPGAAIDVSAGATGDGGTAVLWSQNYTAFRGAILASGGSLGGNGGQVETSSATNLEATGTVDARAPAGVAGAWLLDPLNVTIAASGPSGNAYATPFVPTANSVILGSSVIASLNGGSNVTITTGTTGSSTGDISVTTPLTWSTNQTLTLTARNNVTIGANVAATGNTAGLIITPNSDGLSGGTYSLVYGNSITLSGLTPSLSIAGHAYTVVNALGVAGDATTTTLQGMKNALTGYYALGANLDASATAGWNAGAGFAPIGNGVTGFSGVFDGLGHAINNLAINRPATDDVGLFGQLSIGGVAQNLALTGLSIAGHNSVGGLAGLSVGGIYFSSAAGQVNGLGSVGGLVGENDGVIKYSYATSRVIGTTDVGGLVGLSAEGTLEQTYAAGNVSGTTNVGGLEGRSMSHNEALSSIEDSYATGDVSGTTTVGGVLGYNGDGDILRAYATGHITGVTNVGGIAGDNEQTNVYTHGIQDGFWDLSTTSQIVAVGLENGQTNFSFGRTTAQLMTGTTYGYNITNVGGTNGAIWRIYDGKTFALLTCFLTPLTVTANNDSKIYTGAAYASNNGAVYSIASPNSALMGTLVYGGSSQTAVNVGASYPITVSGLYSLQQGYDVSYVGGTLAIGKATLTLTGTRVYDNSTIFAGSNLTANGVAGQTFTVTGAGAVGNLTAKDVQSAQLLASVTGLSLGGSGNGGLASNYNVLSTVNSAVSVTPAPLMITADNKSRATNLANPPLTATYTGLVGDVPSVVSGLVLTTTAVLSSPAGGYPITASGGSALDYTISYVPGTLTLTSAAPVVNPLTITANDQSKLYGAALPTFTASYAGFVNGDTPAVVSGLQYSTTAAVSSNVGVYSITPFGATAPNYSLTFVPGKLTINPVALTISGNSATRLYGAANPAFGVTYAGFVNGDTSVVVSGLTIASPATVSSNVGSYAVVPASATAANYTITYVPGALAITPAPLMIAADNKSRPFATANPALTAAYSGFVNGDTASVVSGLTLTTTAVLNSPVGNYPIAGFGAAALNYAIGYLPGTLAIGPQPLTITALDLSKLYGAPLPVFSASFAGFVNGDTTAVVSGLQFSTTATAGSNVGTYAITPSGATAPNYVLAYVPGKLTISPAALTITGNNGTRLYGTPNPALSVTYAGFVNGDSSAVVSGLTITTPATITSNVGIYPITPFGATAPNYLLAYVPGKLTINPAALTITANDAVKMYGAPLPVFSASYAGFVNGDTSAVVSGLQLSTTAVASSNVGTYPITAFGATAPNYLLTYVPGKLTINPAALTITGNSGTRLYGTPNPALSVTYAGFVNGDTSTVVSGLTITTPATITSNVGTYAISPASAAAANYLIGYVPGVLTINPAPLTVTAASATRDLGAINPIFTGTIAGLLNGDNSTVVTGLTYATPATLASAVGDYAIVPSGGKATNYTFVYVDGALHILGPTASDLGTGSASDRIDQRLAITLDQAVIPPDEISFMDITSFGDNSSLGALNFGSFEWVSTVSGDFAAGGLGGGSLSARMNEEGVYRETLVGQGGYNVIYHEALAEARQQAVGNTALGSSYREFSDSDNPQVNLVRTKMGRKPGAKESDAKPSGSL
jgi:filamentous hemagglutinin family protein